MMTVQDASQLYDYDVLDGQGNKVGSVDGVWVDDATNRPEFVAVKTGFFGKDHVIPIEQAQLDSDNQTISVPYSEDQIKNGPSFSPDDTLSDDDEQQIYSYYGLQRSTQASPTGYAAGAGANAPSGENENVTWNPGQGTGGTGAPYTVGEEQPSNYTETVNPLNYQPGGEDVTEVQPSQYETAAPQGQTTMTGNETTLSAGQGQIEIPVVEEQPVVSTQQVQREAQARVRLRKVVRTEHEEIPVELRRETVTISRVPSDQLSGIEAPENAFQEETIDIPVIEEEPVIQKESHVAEAIRITKTPETVTETVGTDLRREEVEVEQEGDVEIEGNPNTPTSSTSDTSS